jgi:hypothetical protein
VPDGVVQERWDDLWGAKYRYVDAGVKMDMVVDVKYMRGR